MDLFATLSLHGKCLSMTKARARTYSLPVKGGKATSTIIMRREFLFISFPLALPVDDPIGSIE